MGTNAISAVLKLQESLNSYGKHRIHKCILRYVIPKVSLLLSVKLIEATAKILAG
jgi:hypothetical protein